MEENKIIEEFLIKLEQIALNLEEEIEKLDKIDSNYRYLSDKVEAIEKYKIGFCKEVAKLKGKKLDEFKKNLKDAGIFDFEIEVLLDEASNLYQLSENKLLDNSDVSDQKAKSDKVINEVKDKMKSHMNNISYLKNEEMLKGYKKHLEEIVFLGTKFEDNRIEDSIDDIDFFNSTCDEMGLSLEEKYELIVMLLENNVNKYKNEIKEEQAVKEAEKNLDEISEEKEDTDLSRMLYEKDDEIEFLDEEDYTLEDMFKKIEEEEDIYTK